MFKTFLLIFSLCIGFAATVIAQVENKASLNFLYIGTPPYIFSINGEIDGIFIEPVEKVAAMAGYTVSWVRMAPNRGFRNFEAGVKPYCVVSQADYYSSDGEHDWLVSDAFASLGAIGLLVREKDKAKILNFRNIKTFVETSTYRGGFLRLSIAKHQQEMNLVIDEDKHLVVDANPFELGQLVARGRIDYLITSEKAVDVHKSFYGEIEPLAFVKMPGIAQRERKINIICNKAVSIEVFTRINRSIMELNKKAAQR